MPLVFVGNYSEEIMDEDTQYFFLGMLYFAVFVIAGVCVGDSHGMVVKLPALGGILVTAFYFWHLCVRR